MLKGRVKKIYFYRHTLWNMATNQLKVKYAGSILGISWAIVNPILIMSAITFVFTVVFKIEVKNFPLFVLSGILPWMFFSSTLTESAFSILNQQNILHQFNLPREILPLSSILSNFLNFLIGWFVIYPLFLFFNPKIIAFLPLLIVFLIFNLFFACGLGFLISVLNVFFRDIGQLLGVLLMFWFWVTPVFYSLDMIPIKFRWICNLNPMTPYVVFYRDIVFTGRMPNFSTFAGIIFWAFISLFLGSLVFIALEPRVLKRI